MLVGLWLACATQQLACPDEPQFRERCLDCNVDNHCTVCVKGYYLDQISGSPDGGHCIACMDKCLECDKKDRCLRCVAGFVNFPDFCTPCEVGCSACALRPSNCVSCDPNYILDSSGECYFRYSLLVILGICLGLLLLFVLLCRLMNFILKEPGRRHGRQRQHHESILGDEYRIDPTYITDVTGIGRQTDLDKNDLSLVAETQVDGHDDSIHSIKDVIPDQPPSPDRNKPAKKPAASD